MSSAIYALTFDSPCYFDDRNIVGLYCGVKLLDGCDISFSVYHTTICFFPNKARVHLAVHEVDCDGDFK